MFLSKERTESLIRPTIWLALETISSTRVRIVDINFFEFWFDFCRCITFNCFFHCFEQLSVIVFNYFMQNMLSSIMHSIFIMIIINMVTKLQFIVN